MRGPIPDHRMQKVAVEFPSSLDLEKEMPPHWAGAEFLFPFDEATLSALRQLWDGLGLLHEARLALVEAEACKIWHEEHRDPPDATAARYFMRYYLDDAALRLYASHEHMLKSIRRYWRLDPLERSRSKSQCERILATLKKKGTQPWLAEALEGLASRVEWKMCVDYRNDWVHNERPNLAGLGPAVRSTATRTDFPSGGWAIQGGFAPCEQRTIPELRFTLRGAYHALHGAFAFVMRRMRKDFEECEAAM